MKFTKKRVLNMKLKFSMCGQLLIFNDANFLKLYNILRPQLWHYLPSALDPGPIFGKFVPILTVLSLVWCKLLRLCFVLLVCCGYCYCHVYVAISNNCNDFKNEIENSFRFNDYLLCSSAPSLPLITKSNKSRI